MSMEEMNNGRDWNWEIHYFDIEVINAALEKITSLYRNEKS